MNRFMNAVNISGNPKTTHMYYNETEIVKFHFYFVIQRIDASYIHHTVNISIHDHHQLPVSAF